MLQAARETAERWSALPDGATISVSHEMMRTTFDVIVETMLSGRNGIDAGRIEQAITTTLGATGWLVALTLLGAPQWSPYPGRRKADAARAYLRAEVRRLVAERRRGAAGDDLIGHLMQAQDPETGESMSDDDIADNHPHLHHRRARDDGAGAHLDILPPEPPSRGRRARRRGGRGDLGRRRAQSRACRRARLYAPGRAGGAAALPARRRDPAQGDLQTSRSASTR